jgi:diguanylate cyclase (GGDEF)-like protein
MTTPSHHTSPPGPGALDRRVHRGFAELSAVALAVVVTVADYFTDPYLAFSTFYLIPVAIMAWYSTRVRALGFCVVVTTAGIVARALDPGAVTLVVIVSNGLLRVVMFVFVVLLVEAERIARDRIARLSTIDPLTGMLNRRAFMAHGSERLAQAARRGSEVTLVYTDLDDLKSRNDAFGHESGDRMITDFVAAMTATFRETDLVTRIGGDEFCCLLVDTGEREANIVLDRFETIMARIGPDRVRASMGAVTTVATAATSLDDLVRAADALMYEAKLAGKGQRRTATIPSPVPDGADARGEG